MTYLNIILIACICVFCIDISGFFTFLKQFIHKKYIKVGKWTDISLKPFDCSLCSTWWASLVYLIVVNQVSFLTIAFALMMACITPQINDLFYLIQDTISTIIIKISNKINNQQ